MREKSSKKASGRAPSKEQPAALSAVEAVARDHSTCGELFTDEKGRLFYVDDAGRWYVQKPETVRHMYFPLEGGSPADPVLCEMVEFTPAEGTGDRPGCR